MASTNIYDYTTTSRKQFNEDSAGMSKTQDAIALVNQGLTPFAAAKQVGLSANTLYVALKKQREKQGVEACPCCGSLVPAEKINRDVLKEG